MDMEIHATKRTIAAVQLNSNDCIAASMNDFQMISLSLSLSLSLLSSFNVCSVLMSFSYGIFHVNDHCIVASFRSVRTFFQ